MEYSINLLETDIWRPGAWGRLGGGGQSDNFSAPSRQFVNLRGVGGPVAFPLAGEVARSRDNQSKGRREAGVGGGQREASDGRCFDSLAPSTEKGRLGNFAQTAILAEQLL